MQNIEFEKDIGVTTDSKLSFERHLNERINKANSMFSLIRRTFINLDEKNFKFLYKSMVRSHLEYASSVWSPYKTKYIDIIENVQKRATKQIPTLKELNYEERLKKLKLPTLVYRRIRGDMIETYKILNNIYDNAASNFLKCRNRLEQNYTLRGHHQQLVHQRTNKQIRQHTFSIRITNIWNNLPCHVVEAPTLNTFKNRLDQHWKHQEILYNHKAALDLGTTNPSTSRHQTLELDTVAAGAASVQKKS